MPTIAGKSTNFIAKALKDFRGGKKYTTVMQHIAKGYTDAQIEQLTNIRHSIPISPWASPASRATFVG